MSWDERVVFSCLLIQIIVRCSRSKHLTLATLELAQNLIISLPSHHNLTMNVLNIHILSTMACIRPHQTRLVSYAGLNVVNGRSWGCLLERTRCYMGVSSLLNAIDRACVLVDVCGLLLLIAGRLLLHVLMPRSRHDKLLLLVLLAIYGGECRLSLITGFRWAVCEEILIMGIGIWGCRTACLNHGSNNYITFCLIVVALALGLALIVLKVNVLARLSTSVVHQELVLLLMRNHLIWINLVGILSYLFEAIANSILTLINLHVSWFFIRFANQLLLLEMMMR